MNRGRYKKSNYRKRRIRTIIIISSISLIVLFAIFMIVGLSLAEKTTEYQPYDDDDGYFETDADDLRKIKSVQAYPLPLLEDGSLFTSRLEKINENATAACISLNRPDGTLLYRSSLASSFTYLETAPDAKSLSYYVDYIEDYELYSTATLYIPTFKETQNDLQADVELAMWGSIVCEAIREGVGDVLIIASDADAEEVARLCALAERIHITEEAAVVGICLPDSVLEDERSVSLIKSLSESFDYLALNTTELSDKATLKENVEAAISNRQPDLLFYKMRVLLPRGASTEELDELIQLINDYDIKSWQALPLN